MTAGAVLGAAAPPKEGKGVGEVEEGEGEEAAAAAGTLAVLAEEEGEAAEEGGKHSKGNI